MKMKMKSEIRVREDQREVIWVRADTPTATSDGNNRSPALESAANQLECAGMMATNARAAIAKAYGKT